MIVDIERVVADYLREWDPGARVVVKAPDEKDTAWVQITLINATAEGQAVRDHLITFNVQLDCYAGADGGIPEANDVARSTREAINEIDEHQHDAVVSGGRITSYSRVAPDADMEPARDRVVITADVWAHA